jgi:uncharacterized coiled-coil protein SlyX
MTTEELETRIATLEGRVDRLVGVIEQLVALLGEHRRVTVQEDPESGL